MRSCGSCNECCVAPEQGQLGKKAWEPCPHLSGGHGGCAIYEDRPSHCVSFTCVWLTSPGIPSRFRPDRSGLLLAAREGGVIDIWETGDESWEGSRLQRFLGGLPDYDVRVLKKAD